MENEHVEVYVIVMPPEGYLPTDADLDVMHDLDLPHSFSSNELERKLF
jgi:hypothetical protein